MRKILFIAAAILSMTVVAVLVWNAPKRPGVDMTDSSAVQTE
jgi:hypothetical protein